MQMTGLEVIEVYNSQPSYAQIHSGARVGYELVFFPPFSEFLTSKSVRIQLEHVVACKTHHETKCGSDTRTLEIHR